MLCKVTESTMTVIQLELQKGHFRLAMKYNPAEVTGRSFQT